MAFRIKNQYIHAVSGIYLCLSSIVCAPESLKVFLCCLQLGTKEGYLVKQGSLIKVWLHNFLYTHTHTYTNVKNFNQCLQY